MEGAQPTVAAGGDGAPSDGDVLKVNLDALFRSLDAAHFGNKLSTIVKVKWDTNMKRDAGQFFHRGRRYCVILLSEPILKLRTVSDLTDILLHEMIHAFLFLTHQPDPLGHGESFLEMMRSINASAGTQIDVHHRFGEEVELYLTHHWQCLQCDLLVKKTRHRPPTSCNSCGGQFIKIKEPPSEKQHRIPSTVPAGQRAIHRFFQSSSTSKRKERGEGTPESTTEPNAYSETNPTTSLQTQISTSCVSDRVHDQKRLRPSVDDEKEDHEDVVNDGVSFSAIAPKEEEEEEEDHLLFLALQAEEEAIAMPLLAGTLRNFVPVRAFASGIRNGSNAAPTNKNATVVDLTADD